jgi:carboxypeptidase C (cathepsin A)
MYLNGIMLVSVVLNFQTIVFEPGNELPYLLYLPSYAATAWYHRRLQKGLLDKSLRDLLDEVEEFAVDEYSLALLKGDALPDGQRRRLVRGLARYTGLSPEFIERANLRVDLLRFTKELLRFQRRTTGRLDGRFKGIDRDAAGEKFEHDPSLSAIMGPFAAVFNQYVRAELNFESDLPYEVLASIHQTWSFAEHENRFVDVGDTLRAAISVNPFLKVFIANGYYDLATPYFATEYTVNHLALDPELRLNVSLKYYDAGHMMYLHMPSLERLKSDLSAFIK